MAKPLTREQEIVRKLRQAAYKTREKRVQEVKDGGLPYSHLDIDEFLEIVPGRRIAWLCDVSGLTPQKDVPLWLETEAVVSLDTKRMIYVPETRVLTFQCREWQTRAIKIDRIFEITIRPIPERETPTERPKRRPQMTKRS